MYLIVIGWLYVALMMAAAEAARSVFGAIVTFVLYGVGPVSLVIYLGGRPARRAARLARERAAQSATPSAEPDPGGKAAAQAVAPVRKEP